MNIDKYIGLPYQENGRSWQGVDCWGLARLYYENELGIVLPDYSDLYSGNRDPNVSSLILDNRHSWIKTNTPVENDLCVFNIYGEPVHIGVYLGSGSFLHTREGLDSVIESVNSIQWSKRLDGYYRYDNSNIVQLVGAPHPLKISTVYEHVTPGTTLSAVVENLYTKYKISERLKSRLIVAVDGNIVKPEFWATTALKQGQQVTYKVVAQGRNGTRLVLTIAVLVASYFTYGATLELLPASLGTPTVGLQVAASIAAATVQVAGMSLVNSIAPIRMPGMGGEDPGQPNQLNLFNGSSNQANRFGAIPIVLGKVRYVGLLGATPYTTTLPNSNILNTLVIWGFGPLQIDDICVGATNLEDAFYDADTSVGLPRPYTLSGSFTETISETEEFNRRYPEDVEQVYSQQGELVNNAQEGTNVWREVTFLQNATSVDVVLTFPEGLRAIKTSGGDAGKVIETTTTVEIQIAKVTDSFGPTPGYQAGPISSSPSGPISVVAFDRELSSSSISTGDDGAGLFAVTTDLFKWYIICITPQHEITVLEGYPTDNKDANPSQSLRTVFETSSLNNLTDGSQTYNRLPEVPTDYVKLYSLCLHRGVIVETINHLTHLDNQGYIGFALTTTPILVGTPGYDEQPSGNVRVQVTGGTYYPQAIPSTGVIQTQTIFATRTNQLLQSGTQTAAIPVVSAYSGWSDLLKQSGVWLPNNPVNIDLRGTFTLSETTECYFEASVDDEAKIYIDGALIFDIPKESWSSTSAGKLRLQAGLHQIQIIANNSEGGQCAVALKVTSKQGTVSAPIRGLGTFLTFGTNDVYSKRKDPFNYVHSFPNLEEAVYKVRVRRVDNDDPENVENLRKYHKVALLNATSYAKRAPLQKLPRGNLARTVIQVQSSNRINGSVDGINALVQTKTYDWNTTTNTWEAFKTTNNPASLFLYILAHPANAFRVAELESNTFITDIAQKVDLVKIQEWHDFCSTKNTATGKPVLSYNGVITGTTSIMDALRDVCAAGLASPIFIDGKWSVVIDKPRDYVVQHFTPHNSWGFESTKPLPKIPDAFRVVIQDESEAYQTKELLVYNYGKSASNAEIFEQLDLPGITNKDQAKFFAKWHLAQLKLRPETYTLNTDFEYLVCNRGDLVKVTHDVPLWGSASGRVKSIAGNTLTLTEDVYLESNKQYRILVRTNTKTNTPGISGIYKNLQAVTQTGYYGVITCSDPVTTTDNIEADNLFMLGELNKETQELVVLAVEPSTNLTARITLTDYSPEIYSLNLNNEFPNVSFNANITATTGAVSNIITGIPTINGVISNRGTSRQISTGTYETGVLISFSNPVGLGEYAKQVQFELIRADEQFSSSNPTTIHITRKETSNYSVFGLTTGTLYKLRARYTDAIGSVYGPWSEQVLFVAGKAGAETVSATLELKLEGTYIVAYPKDFDLPNDFKTYEYRIKKDTGTEDFWDLDPTNIENKIQVTQSIVEGRFNLLDQESPRLSETGITYKVACRVVTRTNEYSNTSAVDTIVVTTIQYDT